MTAQLVDLITVAGVGMRGILNFQSDFKFAVSLK